MGLAQKEKNYNRLISTGASMAKRINRPVVWNVLNPMSSSQNTKKNDKCGFGCKFKKGMQNIGSSFQQSMYERKEKKAKSYGFSSFGEWEKAAKQAEQRGYSKAGKKRLKEIEARAAGSKNIAGGTSNLAKGISLFDEFMGVKPAPKRRKAPSKRKTAPKYVVVGGKAYQKAAPKRRAAPREEPFFTW